MLKLKDLLEVIEEGTKLYVIDWSEIPHNPIYEKKYELESLSVYDDYKIVSIQQFSTFIEINIMKGGDK